MTEKMWGGRFQGSLDERIDSLNRSFPYDQRLHAEDIEGSMAWARALQRAGILNSKETRAILKGLGQVRVEFEKGTFQEKPGDEDIHTAVERRLVEIVGSPGEKLHTGRSRNDQVATDLALWLRKACVEVDSGVRVLIRALLGAAQRAGMIAIPAYTHLQRAQPVLVAHHLLAYAEMLSRDLERLAGAGKRCDVMPLGSAAATGAGFPIDRKALAADLGFSRVSANSLDAVGSRDGALEFLSATTILGVHLSRLGEEVVLWSSCEFGFVTLGDAVATGSSILPQKKNPDGAELARGKLGRTLGHFVALATTLKGLPLAYNKDLQEDKEACFDALDTALGVCLALTATLEGIEFDPVGCAAALDGGHLLATELADYLVGRGIPFRKAHAVVGRLVLAAEKKGCDVSELDLEALRAEAQEFDEDVARALTVKAALAAKNVHGGTAPGRVKRALASWKKRIDGWS